MSTHLDEEQPTTVQEIAADKKPDSGLESLRQKREAIATNQFTDLPVPGYDGSPPYLYVRYGLLKGPDIKRITDKVMRETKDQWDRQMLSSIDAMVEACQGFFIDYDDGRGRQPLTLHGEPILNYGPEIAEALGIEDAASARKVVKEVFGNNDVALAAHNIQISRWMSNTAIKVDEEYLGNP